MNTKKYSSEIPTKKRESILDRLWDSGPTARHTDAHSKTLTSNLATYELQCKFITNLFVCRQT